MAVRTKYRPEFCDQVRKLCQLGLTNEELAKFFEVSRETLNQWMHRYPEFRAELLEGKTLADAEVANKLFHRACGYSHAAVKILQYEGAPIVVDYTEHYPPDTMACIYWLNNRRRQNWQRTPDKDGGDDDLPPTKVIFEVRDARKASRRTRDAEPAAV